MKTNFKTKPGLHLNYLLIITLFSFLYSCEPDKDTLRLNKDKIEFEAGGGTSTFVLETDAASWEIENPGNDWIDLSLTSGDQQEALVSINVRSKTMVSRTDSLIITAGNADPVYLFVTQAPSDYIYSLSVTNQSLNFKKEGGEMNISITTDAPGWEISGEVDWIETSATSGGSGNTMITISTTENNNIPSRSSTLLLQAESAPAINITIFQNGDFYPDYNTSPKADDNTGMEHTAEEIAADMKLGFNIGNTLEAIGGETNWGNPEITDNFIKLLKENGFNAIRLPCSWNQYMENSNTAEIKQSWLNRVTEVVQYCINNDLYVLLNIHWDGGWLEENCTTEKKDKNNAKQRAFWQQIATQLRDFDERLLFASANEPHVDNATEMSVLKSYHQTFIDAVRGTGGKNAYRTLVVQGPATDIEKTNHLMSSLPSDPSPDRLMIEVHFYTPWNFCGLESDATWGDMFYYWGEGNHSTTDTKRNPTWGEEDTVNELFELMNNKYVSKGYPVILGEYGAIRRSSLTGDALTNHLNSRAYYLKYVTEKAIEKGLIPFYWDNGVLGNNGYGIFDRKNNTVFDQQALDALLEATTP